MYLHIGGEYQLSTKLILAIIDLDQTYGLEKGSINQEYLKKAEENNFIELIDIDIPKSLILTLERAYLSPISASTLRKRLQKNINWNDIL